MKLTTKLLLSATVVAGLSISAFAACATDVYMGNKQLKDVAEPTLATDAATKAYVDSKGTGFPFGRLTCDGTVHSLSNVDGVNYSGKIILISGVGGRTAAILNTHHTNKVTQDLSFSTTYSITTASSDAALVDVNLTESKRLALTINSVSEKGYKCITGNDFTLNVLGQ